MQLGNFSVSLTVKDLAVSRAFYEKLGFRVFGGDAASGWLILQNDTSTIGLFQGTLDKNMLTVQPGLGPRCQNASEVRRYSRLAQRKQALKIDRR